MKQADLVLVLERLKVLRERVPEIFSIEKQLARLTRKYIDLEKEARSRKNRHDAVVKRRSWLWIFDEIDGTNDMLAWLKDDIDETEQRKKEVENEMEKLVIKHPVYNYYLKKQPGIGPVLAAQLLGWLQPWRFKSPSAMIKYVGYSPASSEKHDRIGKTIVHKIVRSMIRRFPNNFWREVYEEFLERVKETECKAKRCSRAHLHMKALRRVKRLFISHYYCAYAIVLKCKHDLDLLPTTHYVATIHETMDPRDLVHEARYRDIPTRYVPPCVPVKGVWTPLEMLICKG